MPHWTLSRFSIWLSHWPIPNVSKCYISTSGWFQMMRIRVYVKKKHTLPSTIPWTLHNLSPVWCWLWGLDRLQISNLSTKFNIHLVKLTYRKLSWKRKSQPLTSLICLNTHINITLFCYQPSSITLPELRKCHCFLMTLWSSGSGACIRYLRDTTDLLIR